MHATRVRPWDLLHPVPLLPLLPVALIATNLTSTALQTHGLGLGLGLRLGLHLTLPLLVPLSLPLLPLLPHALQGVQDNQGL